MGDKKEDSIHRIVVEGEEVALKKDFMGWRVVHPIRNTDGSINWFNFFTGGSWIKLIIIIFIIGVILGFIQEYVSHLNLLTKCLTALNDSVVLIS